MGTASRDEPVLSRDRLDTQPQTHGSALLSHDRVVTNVQGCSNMTTQKVTLLMLLCGLVLSTAAAADAAPDHDVPSRALHFSRHSLATDAGALAVYRSIVRASQEVCPLLPGRPFVTGAVKECRDQAVARAVKDIGSARLVALHADSANRG